MGTCLSTHYKINVRKIIINYLRVHESTHRPWKQAQADHFGGPQSTDTLKKFITIMEKVAVGGQNIM